MAAIRARPTPRTLYTPFGNAVKKKMIDLGVTQAQMERDIGAPTNFVTAILRGDRPGHEYVPLIAEYLGIDPEKYAV